MFETLNNKKDKFILKGYYPFNDCEYTLEEAILETTCFLEKNKKHINNLSPIEFKHLKIEGSTECKCIHVYFSMESDLIEGDLKNIKYELNGINLEIECLLGVSVDIDFSKKTLL